MVPDLLKVAEIDLEVAILVRIHVRHPVVAFEKHPYYIRCTIHATRVRTSLLLNFILSLEIISLTSTTHRLIFSQAGVLVCKAYPTNP